MTKPFRLQLSRRKGFNLQATSRTANGLAAITVARPGRWGNPFRIGVDGSQAECVARFRDFAAHKMKTDPEWLTELAAALRGKNLACWCRPGTPCHADVLLALANQSGKAKT
jgi:hypothetical protein